jgi:branched-subunit amino acid permease
MPEAFLFEPERTAAAEHMLGFINSSVLACAVMSASSSTSSMLCGACSSVFASVAFSCSNAMKSRGTP